MRISPFPRRRRLALIPVGFACLLVAAAAVATFWSPAESVGSAPEPSPFPVSWELTFEHGTPKRIAFRVKGQEERKAYWYMTYRITNETGQPVTFLPQFDLLTKDGEVHRSDRRIPKKVYDAIKKREGNDLLEPPTTFATNINIGEDEARDSVAVWEEPMRDMGSFSIFVGGLSGEWAELKDEEGNPVMTEALGPDGQPAVDENGEAVMEPIILFKTLRLNYYINGDDVYPGEDPVNVGEDQLGRNAEQWVMR